MANVGFEIKNIEKARKDGFVAVTIVFDNSDKEYVYIRRTYGDTVLIDGCRITFDEEYNVVDVVREYYTKGRRKTKSNYKRNYKEETSEEVSEEQEEKKISEAIKEEMEEKEIQAPEVEESGEVHHESYETIKTCLECNIPVYLAGPAGSGKNHTVEQIANELGWNFYFSNSVQQEYKLTGFIDAGGKFHETEFYKACTDENDCIFFLDEMDASIPEVLVLLNAAIANGYFEFPNGRVNLDHVHFVAAGNTVGSGADEMYTGRMVLDQATLDRFAIVEFGYSKKIEMAITKKNTELVEFVHQLRKEAEEKGIRATFSYRCLTMITKLEKAGMELEMAMKISILKGMDKDTINTLNPVGASKYHEALRKIKRAV